METLAVGVTVAVIVVGLLLLGVLSIMIAALDILIIILAFIRLGIALAEWDEKNFKRPRRS
jgi:hypothetical protein